jgi:hypothetical protein
MMRFVGIFHAISPYFSRVNRISEIQGHTTSELALWTKAQDCVNEFQRIWCDKQRVIDSLNQSILGLQAQLDGLGANDPGRLKVQPQLDRSTEYLKKVEMELVDVKSSLEKAGQRLENIMQSGLFRTT